MIELSYWRNVQLNHEKDRGLAIVLANHYLRYPEECDEETTKEVVHLLMIGSHVGRIGDVENTI